MSQPTPSPAGTTPVGPMPPSNSPSTPTKMGSFIQSPGTIKKVLSIIAFFMGFVTVMLVLFIYMNNTGKF